MWAGLTARFNQQLACNIGYLTPLLYMDDCRAAFKDITEGNNGSHFHAEPGWDACTGWGSPDGRKLLAALTR
jgi:kumamolisin